MSRHEDLITRVEVHLSDENSAKKGGNDDIRCMMEARLEGRQPLAVTHQAATVDQAVDGAADKLTSVIESTLGRLRDQKLRRTDPPHLGRNSRRSDERHQVSLRRKTAKPEISNPSSGTMKVWLSFCSCGSDAHVRLHCFV